VAGDDGGALSRLELALDSAGAGTGRAAAVPSVVDVLFDGALQAGPVERAASRDEIAKRMEAGGFPLRAVRGRTNRTARVRRDQVAADVEAALQDASLSGERIDVFRAERVLNAVVAPPAAILNVSGLAGELGMARQTVDAYLGHLERRFLVHRLPNFAARARAQGVGKAHPKMHPVDTALSIAVLDRMGHAFRGSAELFGAVFESFVVNELMAQANWSAVQPEIGFWRDVGRRGDAEIDLLLTDGGGRSVGVEVKSSGTARTRDASGLLARRAAQGLHRGFVVYLGTEVVELDEGIWAVPFSWLTAYEHLHAERVEVFVDHDVRWGEKWQERITAELERAAFLICIITPRYLRSAACREELLQFSDDARRLDEPGLVLPLLWLPTPSLTSPSDDGDDEVVRRLREAQWVDVTDLRFEEPVSMTYRRRLEDLAGRLHETIGTVDARRLSGDMDPVAGPQPDGPGLDDLLEDAEAAQELVIDGFAALTDALTQVHTNLASLPELPPSAGSARVLRAWATRTAEVLAPPAEDLDAAVVRTRSGWAALDDAVTGVIRWAEALPPTSRPAGMRDLADQMVALRDEFDAVTAAPGIADLDDSLRVVAAASRRLRPVARAVEASLILVRDLRASTAGWVSTMERLLPA
jgi:Domain of unknown function (DUF4143)/TIR domain